MTSKIIGFKVIEAHYSHLKDDWECLITRLLQMGWELHGLPILPNSAGPEMYYAQALILREKDPADDLMFKKEEVK